MLGVLVLEGITAQCTARSRQGRASCGGSQVVRVPSPETPPQFMDVLICTKVVYMLGVLVLEGIAAQHVAHSSEVVSLPSSGTPPQFMDVLICTEVVHMLGVLVLEGIAAQ